MHSIHIILLRLALIFLYNVPNQKYVEGANILGLMGVASPSHHIWNRVLMQELAERGHNVTVISPDMDSKNIPSTLHYIHAEKTYEIIGNLSDGLDLLSGPDMSSFEDTKTPWIFGDEECLGIVQSNGFHTLLNYPENFKFDLIIYDYTCGPCLLVFLHKFKYPPMIGVSAFSVPHYTYELVGGHKQHAYIPHFSVEYNNDMTFFERVHNILLHGYEYVYKTYVGIRNEDSIVRPYCNDCPYLGDMEKHMRLALVNTHYAVESSEPLPVSVIPVGGMHIKDPVTLDPKIKNFIEAGEKGAVLFSLGTNIKSKDLDPNCKYEFLTAFNRFPEYNFIWKYESDFPKDTLVPKNVMITPWLNQNSILAHPNTKAFITHSGLLSTQEAVWWGVPMIAIPFFVDQHKNAQKSVQSGIGIKLHFKDITANSVESALREILYNHKYRYNVKIKSKLFQDQPEKPLDRAVFWVEWMLRHKNDWEVIESPVKRIGTFIANGFDMILILFLIILFLFYQIISRIKSNKIIIEQSNNNNNNKKKRS